MADIRLAAAVVVDDSNRVLIVRRSFRERFLPGRWGVPCGKLNEGEKPEDAAVRELREETGLIGEVVGYGGQSSFRSVKNGRAVENEQRNYLVRPLTTTVRTPGGEEHQWLPLGDVERVGLLDQHNVKAIRDALRVRAGGHPARAASTASS